MNEEAVKKLHAEIQRTLAGLRAVKEIVAENVDDINDLNEDIIALNNEDERLAALIDEKVPQTRTINGLPLTSDIEIPTGGSDLYLHTWSIISTSSGVGGISMVFQMILKESYPMEFPTTQFIKERTGMSSSCYVPATGIYQPSQFSYFRINGLVPAANVLQRPKIIGMLNSDTTVFTSLDMPSTMYRVQSVVKKLGV